MPYARLARAANKFSLFFKGVRLRRKYRELTMVPQGSYWKNLAVAQQATPISGCIVECGTWRGGMLAGLAETLGSDRCYIGFDSFAGLPPAQPIDGAEAMQYQADRSGVWFHDNCTAKQSEAETAMRMSGAKRVELVVGWFEETVPGWVAPEPIALLRLDGDWYDSTKVCLQHLIPQMTPGGLVIVDDYYAWGGCAKAIHEWLATTDPPVRLRQAHNDVCYFTMPITAQGEAAVPGVAP
ncbi:MAG: TylF/MycF/NovP-related O-methyltransferase [Planctomycetaceae bacterium]|nr:TylF/MycF/NovP-related O-methyltransferase [Planctomycetaceae bacterium]